MATLLQEAAMRAEGDLGADDMAVPTPNAVLIVLAQKGGRVSYCKFEHSDGTTTYDISNFSFEDGRVEQLLESIRELREVHKLYVTSYGIKDVDDPSEPAEAATTRPKRTRVIVELR